MEKQAELTFEAIGGQNQMVSFCQHPHDALALFFVLCTNTIIYFKYISIYEKRPIFLNNWFVWKII